MWYTLVLRELTRKEREWASKPKSWIFAQPAFYVSRTKGRSVVGRTATGFSRCKAIICEQVFHSRSLRFVSLTSQDDFLSMNAHMSTQQLAPVRSSRFSFDPVLLLLLGLSLAGNVWLAVQLLQPSRSGKSDTELEVGQTGPPFEAQDFAGRPVTYDFRSTDNRHTVLYVFSTTCPWCTKNLPNIKALNHAMGDTFRFTAVSLDPDVAAYMETHQIGFKVLVRPSARTISDYGLGSVPYTLVISPTGKVLHVWRGAYRGRVAAEIERTFDIVLPGLLPTSAAF